MVWVGFDRKYVGAALEDSKRCCGEAGVCADVEKQSRFVSKAREEPEVLLVWIPQVASNERLKPTDAYENWSEEQRGVADAGS